MTAGSWREHLATIRPDADPAEADWWDTTWESGTPPAVGLLIPRGFDSYARVLHPAYDGKGRDATWAEVAAHCGTTLHPEAQWHRIAGGRDLDPRGEGPEQVQWTGGRPEEGRLERTRFVALAEMLFRHTRTPDDTIVAFWNGYGIWPRAWQDLPQVPQPGREYFLFRRPVAAVGQLCAEAPAVRLALGEISDSFTMFVPEGQEPPPRTTLDELFATMAPHEWQSPSQWWPADRAWATSNDTDLDSTLVGGSRALIDELLADDRLEVLPWTTHGSLWSDADSVNT